MFIMRVIVLYSVVVLNTGFLLKNNNPQQSGTVSNQHPSMAKYLADQSSMHHELETLRRQQEMSLNLLTSQLEQKLAEMEAKILEQPSRNDTCKVLYEKLEQNVQKVEQNNTRLVGDLETLHHRYNLLNRAFENTTTKLENSLQELKQLKNIQQLQSLNNLNEKIRKLDSSVSSLRSHEQARNQDFLALYNLTMQSESAINNKVNQHQTDLQNVDKEMNSKITELQRLTSQMKQNQKKQQNVNIEMNNTVTEIQRNISNKVALTACVIHRQQFSSGEAIKFTDIRTNIGYTGISSFQSTGQFVCPVSDLYHISVVLMSKSKGNEIRIFKNSHKIVSGWIDDYYQSSNPTKYWSSAAAVTTTWLKVGDTVKITSSTSASIEDTQTSCLTIVRLT